MARAAVVTPLQGWMFLFMPEPRPLAWADEFQAVGLEPAALDAPESLKALGFSRRSNSCNRLAG